MLRTTALLLYLMPWAAGAQAPVWQWATALRGSTDVTIHDVAGSTLDGCFVYGSCNGSLYLPFDTLEAGDGLGAHFVVHVDSLGTPTWAGRFTVPIASMTPALNGGLSCRFIVNGSVLVNGWPWASTPGTIDIGRAVFTSTGDLESMGGTNNVFQGDPAGPILCDHISPAGVLLATYVQDSLGVRDEWVHGNGILVVRLSEIGALQWYTLLEGPEFVTISGLHLSPSSRTLICTNDAGSDSQLRSYDYQGGLVWNIGLYGLDQYQPVPLTRRLNYRVLVGTGYSTQAPSGGTSLFVEEYELDGDFMNSTGATDPQLWGNAIRSLHDLPDGSTLVGGYQVGQLTFGPLVQSTSGTDGFVGLISPSGTWVWVARETAGNVFGLRAAPGSNSRHYCAGTSDTGVQFGAHVLPSQPGSMFAFVACLGDILLDTPEQAVQEIRPLLAWPNPAQDLLNLSSPLPQTVQIFDLLGRDHTAAVLVKDANTLDVSRLPPGAYVIQLGMSRTVFIKA
jgi:hypothetical protein